MVHLPIREIVLYKNGVGFFVRAGQVSGTQVDLIFREEDINDVLKSLTIFDRAGGTVLGLDYQTPMDNFTRLENTTIRPDNQHTLRDLLGDLRGRKIRLGVATAADPIEGRLVGMELPQGTITHAEASGQQMPVVVALLVDDGQVQFYPLEDIRFVTILEDQAREDLDYFLDSTLSESKRRTIGVRLSEGKHDLMLHYVAPAPTWRVSYRVVAETEAGSSTGKLALLGWGIFDNRLDEDLDGVRVTLVAGQPISFIYDLYSSHIPERPWVEDEARVAPRPIKFDRMMANASAAKFQDYDEDSIQNLTGKRHFKKIPGMYVGGGAPDDISRESISNAFKVSVESSDKGELFQYAVTTPVSVKRGSSTLVPILSTEVAYQKELIYNGAKHPQHPIVTLHFKNASGLTLEQGPVTLVENGDYKGEAILPFSKEDQDVYLPFAVELGIRIIETSESKVETKGLTIEGGFIIFDVYHSRRTHYQLESTLKNRATVTIEQSILANYRLVDTQPPSDENATERRWKIDVPASGKQDFTVTESTTSERRQEVRRLKYQQLQEFFENKWLNKSTFAALENLLKTLASIETLTLEQSQMADQTTVIYQQQEQLRLNLNALQTTDAEGQLRSRMLGKLSETQDQLDALDARRKTLQQEIEALESQAQAIINGLG